jgi:putative Ca2+/H+ antiporter (TMEM165/GDT1 family)
MTAAASVVATTYAAVLLAELGGDRSLCAVGSLAARLRALPVLLGVVAAFIGKALAAVLLGSAVARLAGSTIALVSAASFLGSAALLWWRRGEDVAPVPETTGWMSTMPLAFSSVFFTEWADVGQLTTAALAARYQAPGAVWAGASLALATKGAFAVTVGAGLARVVPRAPLRAAGIGLCLLMAAVSLLDVR